MNQKELLQYSLGALLYTPATRSSVAEHILEHTWPELTSVCLCLEDSILESALDRAEKQLTETLRLLHEAGTKELPAVFVRVRSPEHLWHIYDLTAEYTDVLTGFVFPKFDLTNGGEWLSTLKEINRCSGKVLYGMPILESRQIASVLTRRENLGRIRELVDRYSDLILNIRVGGNDFCNLYGLRRGVNQTVYDLGVVRDILTDILNVFSDAYPVSGPVWEYYGKNENEPWAEGLKKELELDRANGLVGKTCIHPSQIALINRSMKVSREDYDDARRILEWEDGVSGVAGSSLGNRMNEVRCHGRWAGMILCRAQTFGINKE